MPQIKKDRTEWWVDRSAGFEFRYRLFTVDGEGVETPFDLAGYEARFQVRAERRRDATLWATMDSQASPTPTITFEASDEDAPAVLDVITGGLPDTLTGELTCGRGWGDIRMQPPDGDAWFLFAGPFVIEETVTTP